jgi:integrase/recombinase XerD
MPQARVLSSRDLRRVLDHVATRPHAARNRAIILCTHWAGMRIGEVALLRVADVLGRDGVVKSEWHLEAARTKGRHGRKVYVSERLRKELTVYARQANFVGKPDEPFFPTQKRTGFSPNSLCQSINSIYDRSGISGATSHSGRRSMLTALAQKGVGVRILAELAGHRDIRVTQRYLDVNENMLRSALELVG